MDEILIFGFLVFLVIILLAWFMKKPPLMSLGSILGFYLGLELFTESFGIGLIMFLLSFYFFIDSLEKINLN